jgi:hypothetical protein
MARRGGPCVDVAAVLGQVPLQSLERQQLPADAAVASAQHAERILEARRGSIGKEVGGHGCGAAGSGATLALIIAARGSPAATS